MPAWQQQFAIGTKTAQTITTTTELTIATLVVNNPSGNAFSVYGLAVVTWGSALTTATARIRLDSITGSAVNSATAQAVTASTTSSIVAAGIVPAAEITERTIVFTITQGAGAGNGSVVECILVANCS